MTRILEISTVWSLALLHKKTLLMNILKKFLI